MHWPGLREGVCGGVSGGIVSNNLLKLDTNAQLTLEKRLLHVPHDQFTANMLRHGHVLGREDAGYQLVVAGQGQPGMAADVITVGNVNAVDAADVEVSAVYGAL